MAVGVPKMTKPELTTSQRLAALEVGAKIHAEKLRFLHGLVKAIQKEYQAALLESLVKPVEAKPEQVKPDVNQAKQG